MRTSMAPRNVRTKPGLMNSPWKPESFMKARLLEQLSYPHMDTWNMPIAGTKTKTTSRTVAGSE